jgi:hypothetical protein
VYGVLHPLNLVFLDSEPQSSILRTSLCRFRYGEVVDDAAGISIYLSTSLVVTEGEMIRVRRIMSSKNLIKVEKDCFDD